ncbi:hypothetical protein BCV72DRAFT_217833 [Rhizopus microsporus var. microsporus]|nr:hypothetical protein BCV72DRAFT_217833 [Rhizopus microsporus var. microsporus]
METVEKDHLEKELKSLSMEDKPSLKRKQPHVDGEDLFTREAVKNWQPPRLRAWHARHTSPETYYFRLVVPGQLQHNGSWSKEEKKRFMERYQEWIDKGIRIGTMWGIFSKAFPHRVGYQCMSYYRSLVKKGILKDENYTIVDGKLKGSSNRFGAPSISNYSLDPEWETEEVKQIERQVDEWIKEFHGGSVIKQPTAVRRKPATAASTTAARPRNQKSRISDMITKMPQKQLRGENDDDDDDGFVDNGDAEVAHLQERDWDKEWKERLEAYKNFLT